MYGNILTNQHCKCGLKFTSAHRDKDGFYCPTCGTRPIRYHINARKFGLEYIFSDVKTGKVLETYSQALDVLIEMNRDFKKVHYDKKRFPKDKWTKEKAHEKRIDSIIETWLKNYDIELSKDAKSDSRVANVKKACRYILMFFEGWDIRDIGRDDVEQFYHFLLDRNYSSHYIDDILKPLKSLLLRYRPDDVPKFPEYTIVPKREKQRLGLTREIAVIDKVPVRHGYRLGILIIIRAGMRIDELPAIRVGDCLDGGIWVDKAWVKKKIEPGKREGKLRLLRKNGGVVEYRLTPELWEMLEEHCRGKNEEDFVFTYYDSNKELAGQNIPAERWYKVWAKACKDAGVRHISLQQASRHSTASRIWAKAKKDALKDISRQLGDNPATVKKHYIIEGKGE